MRYPYICLGFLTAMAIPLFYYWFNRPLTQLSLAARTWNVPSGTKLRWERDRHGTFPSGEGDVIREFTIPEDAGRRLIAHCPPGFEKIEKSKSSSKTSTERGTVTPPYCYLRRQNGMQSETIRISEHNIVHDIVY